MGATTCFGCRWGHGGGEKRQCEMRVDVILSWGMQITSPVQRGSPPGGFLWSCIFRGEKKDSVRGLREMPRSCARVPHRVPHLVAHAVDKEILLLLVSSAQRTGVASELVRGSCRGVGHQEEMKGGWLICRWGLAACEEMPQTRRCSWQWWRQLLWRFLCVYMLADLVWEASRGVVFVMRHLVPMLVNCFCEVAQERGRACLPGSCRAT